MFLKCQANKFEGGMSVMFSDKSGNLQHHHLGSFSFALSLVISFPTCCWAWKNSLSFIKTKCS